MYVSVVYSSHFLESQKHLKCLCFSLLLKSHPIFPLVPKSPRPSGSLQGVGLAMAMPVFLLLGIPSTVNLRGHWFTGRGGGALLISLAYPLHLASYHEWLGTLVVSHCFISLFICKDCEGREICCSLHTGAAQYSSKNICSAPNICWVLVETDFNEPDSTSAEQLFPF